MTLTARLLRHTINLLVKHYHRHAFPAAPFKAGVSRLPYAGRVFGAEELQAVVGAGLDFWLTAGPNAKRFESEFAKVCQRPFASLTNSGSSANLLAMAALTSPELGADRLLPGDEVVTCAVGFPTTLNPILQNGLVPVFVDATLGTLNADAEQVIRAMRRPQVRAVMLAHTLGNPFPADTVASHIARHHGKKIWFIEDCCDALGSTLNGKQVGTFSDLATFSFYPAHHITMGEGGCVTTRDALLRRLVESFRDWGRDCHCAPGQDNACGKRFKHHFPGLPLDYDHKFIYSHVGYNMKATDLQAAIGLEQLKRLPEFHAARRRNFAMLHDGLEDMRDCFILPEPEGGSDPSWFGFPLTVLGTAPFSRHQAVEFLESCGVATRMVFGGNLTQQPAYAHLAAGKGEFPVANRIASNTFWVGVYPGLSEEMVTYMIRAFHALRLLSGIFPPPPLPQSRDGALTQCNCHPTGSIA